MKSMKIYHFSKGKCEKNKALFYRKIGKLMNMDHLSLKKSGQKSESEQFNISPLNYAPFARLYDKAGRSLKTARGMTITKILRPLAEKMFSAA